MPAWYLSLLSAWGILGAMSLAHFRRRLHVWTRTFIGRLSVLVLLAALVPGARAVVEHAHDDGDHDHGHSAQLSLDDRAVDEAGEADDVQLHQHEVYTTVSDLPPPVLLPEVSVAPKGLVMGRVAALPPASPRSPPHRPPIA